LTLQNFLLQGFNGKFNMENFHRRKKSFITPSFGVNSYAGAAEKKVELAHPALYYQLKKLRDNICSKRNLPIYLVASSKTLEEMTTYLPRSLEELEQISGFGKAKIESYGAEFLSIIQEYSFENNLDSNIAAKPTRRKQKEKETKEIKNNTKEESLKLYKEGKTVAEIAKERNLTTQTIEGHLAYYVSQGDIKIEELVGREKMVLIEPLVKNFKGGSITPIKEKLGNNVSYGEIRLMIAGRDYQNQRPM
jgi:ATP-dependent DNA helicase RecQ